MNRTPLMLCVAMLVTAVALVTGNAFAQTTAPAPPPATSKALPLPPKLEPLPEISGDSELEPQVTITRKEGETVEEARVGGKLMWVKVTPTHGRPYFLIPDAGGHTYIRRDSLDTGLKVPLWVLFTF